MMSNILDELTRHNMKIKNISSSISKLGWLRTLGLFYQIWRTVRTCTCCFRNLNLPTVRGKPRGMIMKFCMAKPWHVIALLDEAWYIFFLLPTSQTAVYRMLKFYFIFNFIIILHLMLRYKLYSSLFLVVRVWLLANSSSLTKALVSTRDWPGACVNLFGICSPHNDAIYLGLILLELYFISLLYWI